MTRKTPTHKGDPIRAARPFSRIRVIAAIVIVAIALVVLAARSLSG